MKTHTTDFKNTIKQFGRELDSKITYTIDGTTTVLTNEQINSVTPHYESSLLKSVMKQLDIDSNVEIPLETIVNYQFGVKVGNSFEYLDYGNYVVYKVEKQEDTRSWKITCYDKMLYAMKNYEQLVSKNLCDYQELNLVTNSNGTTTTSNGYYNVIIETTDISSLYISGDFTLLNSNTLRIGGYSTYPAVGVNGTRYNVTSNSAFSTNNHKYIMFCFLAKQGNTIEEIKNSFQIEKGNRQTSFTPFFKYPITIKNYLKTLTENIGLELKDTNFVNQDKEIQSELYLDSDGNSLDYTYRDVLDEIAQVTASVICINEDDKLEVRYINQTIGKNLFNKNDVVDGYLDGNGNVVTNTTFNVSNFIEINGNDITISGNYGGSELNAFYDENKTFISTFGMGTSTTKTISIPSNAKYLKVTVRDNVLSNYQVEIGDITNPIYEPYGDTIDEEYLKDVNVNFGEKYGPVNSVVLSRSAESDNIYQNDEESIEENGLTEIKIKDNQILNGNNRDEFLQGIFNQLNGIEYYINDYTSTGIAYYDLMDMYNVKVDNNFYKCLMLNDELDVTQGLQETIHAERMEDSETDYTKADKTDRKINQAYIIVDKQNQQINSVVQTVNTMQNTINNQGEQIDALGTRITQSVDNITASVTSIQEELDNGVNLVKTTSVIVDDNGLTVATDTSKTTTTMTSEKFTINSGGKELAFFGYDDENNSTKAQMDNLTVTNYFVAGYHRTEKYDINFEHRTGVFYIGE